jgi:hypothetical protein
VDYNYNFKYTTCRFLDLRQSRWLAELRDAAASAQAMASTDRPDDRFRRDKELTIITDSRCCDHSATSRNQPMVVKATILTGLEIEPSLADE